MRIPSFPIRASKVPRRMLVVLQAGQPARPEPASCRALPRRWGLPLAFTCLRPCQCDAISPALTHAPTHPYCEILGNPASRAQTSTLPFPYLASLLVRRPSYLSQTTKMVLRADTTCYRAAPSRVIAITSSPQCLRTTRRRLPPSRATETNITQTTTPSTTKSADHELNAILPAM